MYTKAIFTNKEEMAEKHPELEASQVMSSSADQFLVFPYACSITWRKSLNFSKPPFSTSMQSEVIIKWVLNEITSLKHPEEGMNSIYHGSETPPHPCPRV